MTFASILEVKKALRSTHLYFFVFQTKHCKKSLEVKPKRAK